MTAHALVDAAEVARFLDVSTDFVYAHADELGARRLGSGPRARLRFDLAEVDARLSDCSRSRESEAHSKRAAEPNQGRRLTQGSGTSAPLLPIRGREEAA
jgi:hypothetical protein